MDAIDPNEPPLVLAMMLRANVAMRRRLTQGSPISKAFQVSIEHNRLNKMENGNRDATKARKVASLCITGTGIKPHKISDFAGILSLRERGITPGQKGNKSLSETTAFLSGIDSSPQQVAGPFSINFVNGQICRITLRHNVILQLITMRSIILA